MLELPANTMALCGGGLVLSPASKALMAGSQRDGAELVGATGFWASEAAFSAKQTGIDAQILRRIVRVVMDRLCATEDQVESGLSSDFSFSDSAVECMLM